MKFVLFSLFLIACSAPQPRSGGARYQTTYRCTALLEAYSNDENLEAIKVLLKEGEVEIQRETEQGMYLSFADPEQTRAEYMVTSYLADRLGGRYIANLLNCFNKNERTSNKRDPR